MVVQENRTPDNLFYADASSLPGFDYATQGPCTQNGNTSQITLISQPLDACFDPSHSHGSWKKMWHNGAMDGACNIPVSYPFDPPPITCSLANPQYTYASNSDHILDPYFQIANTYGFCNYCFQTNQGASFPAHQFLFSGTSAPVCCGDANNFYKWFVAENPRLPDGGNAGSNTGCTAPQGEFARLIDLDKYESSCPNSQDPHCAYTCYDHKTMADVLNPLPRQPQDPPNWLYYAETAKGLWTAPNAIQSICGGIFYGGGCQNTEDWQKVITKGKRNGDLAAILTDIEACRLPKVAWVVPDGHWSDHPGHSLAQGDGPHDGGPSWVAAIINAVGDATTCDSAGYWDDTVIIVVWDDWGGFYDHVAPYRCTQQLGCLGYPTQDPDDSGKQYLYGFRVPMLVIGKYVRPHYISGALPPYGQGEVPPYIHDFGSILSFIEFTFGVGQIEERFPYADHWAPDAPPACPTCTYSLADFFDFAHPQPFTRITGAKYDASCFHTGSCFSQNFVDADPDDDAIHQQD